MVALLILQFRPHFKSIKQKAAAQAALIVTIDFDANITRSTINERK